MTIIKQPECEVLFDSMTGVWACEHGYYVENGEIEKIPTHDKNGKIIKAVDAEIVCII